MHYEPKGDDDDFLSSIGSPRSVHSGDEGMLTSGDEFLSCDGDNDADDRLASVVSDVESVGMNELFSLVCFLQLEFCNRLSGLNEYQI